MTKWLAEYSIEAHCCLATDNDTLEFVHPTDLYTIQLKNMNVTPPVETPLLSAQIVFEASSAEEAEELSRKHLRDFLERLTLVTCHKFKVDRLHRIVDWHPGIEMRELVQVNEIADPNLPQPILNQELLESVAAILRTKESEELAELFRWFALGVGADYSDEQFQFFWFVLEVLTRIDKDTQKVPDRCPVCREPLYCHSCETTPTHRPYQSQAIEVLIRQYSGEGNDSLIEMAKTARNAMMHGKPLGFLEEEYPHSFDDLVNFIGGIAWAALSHRLVTAIKKTGESGDLPFVRVESFTHQTLVLKNLFKVGTKDPDNPSVEDLPGINISMLVSEKE